MRITTGMYYKNMYANDNKIQNQYFDVNKQISSGLSIQYAYDDTDTFVQTMGLDNEITTLQQVVESSESGLKFSQQSDSTIGEIITTLESFKVKMIQAASDSQSATSLEAIGKELGVLREHLLSLANTSINGEYLFSGTATRTKPFSDDGSYNGNDETMTALTGNDVYHAYNVSGQELFFGEETRTQRRISTNVPKLNLSTLYPHVLEDGSLDTDIGSESYIDTTDRIRDLIGDVNSQVDIDSGTENYSTTYFYLRGTAHDGTAFKQKIAMDGDESVQALLDKIGEAYGNTPTNSVVNVTLNEYGQIEIEDKLAGSSKLDFHMVAATDFDLTDGTDDADVANGTNSIDDLNNGENDFEALFNGTSSAANPNLLISEFTLSGYGTAAANAMEGITYDRVDFDQDGAILTALVPQIVNGDNSFATASTKLSEVASGGSLDGVTLNLEGSDINGAAYTATINLSSAGSTFTVGGTTYTIYNTGVDPKAPITAANPMAATDADEVTYQQLTDVINMIVTDNLPASAASVDGQGIAADYRAAIDAANTDGETRLTADGRLEFEQIGTTDTAAGIRLYDAASSDFTDSDTSDPEADTAAALTFHGNTALTISDPKNDFFAMIDEMLGSIDELKMRADGTRGDDARNNGMQNGIQMLDDLLDHLSGVQAESGANSQSLTATRNRTEVLIVSATTLRSEVLDTDLAEASLRLQQLSLNYQAMMSTISRVSQLSLVNYL